MKFLIFFGVLLLPSLFFAQTTEVTIHDSNGNRTTGTINQGNVYFHDSNGNTSFGTIRNGNVFLSSNTGEITFGTVRDGNIFLTDNKGITTGTIRNGNIFLNNSDGSMTTGTYDRNGNMYTNTSALPSQPTVQTQSDDERRKQIQQENYDAGYAVGSAVGNVIMAVVNHKREKKFCQQNPDRCQNGHVIRVVQDPYVAQFAALHAETKRIMDETRQEMVATPQIEAYASIWKSMVNNLCSTYPTDTYTDLDGAVKTCNSRNK
jgi:hypothetical protein